MIEGYQLSEQAVRKIAEAARIIESLGLGSAALAGGGRRNSRPIRYRKTFYRIVTDAGGGAYTLRKQAWSTSTDALADVTDADDPEYGLNQAGYDYLGQADGEVDAIVPGWKVYVDGEPVLLVAAVVAAGSGGGALEWGFPTTAFTSGTNITLIPCDPGLIPNGLPSVSARMAADGLSITMDIAYGALVSFVRDPLTGDCQVVGLPNDTLAGVFPDNGLTGTVDLVTDVTYDTSSKKLEQWKITLTFEKGVLTEASDPPVASTVDTAVDCAD